MDNITRNGMSRSQIKLYTAPTKKLMNEPPFEKPNIEGKLIIGNINRNAMSDEPSISLYTAPSENLITEHASKNSR